MRRRSCQRKDVYGSYKVQARCVSMRLIPVLSGLQGPGVRGAQQTVTEICLQVPSVIAVVFVRKLFVAPETCVSYCVAEHRWHPARAAAAAAVAVAAGITALKTWFATETDAGWSAGVYMCYCDCETM